MTRYGAAEPLGATGLVVGRFLPLHRGHEYLIDLARASVQKLTVVVLADEGDPISHRTRVRWIAERYPDVRVEHAASPRALEPFGRHAYLFTADAADAGAARAVGAELVTIEPVVAISSAAIRAHAMEQFRHIARPARPWSVRRVAIVGGEGTGKTALCAWLRERFGCLAAPAWTHHATAPERVQLAARSQLAAEDALASQLPPEGTAGILLCDTDLWSLVAAAEQSGGAPVPAWIRTEAERRPYDLYLACGPDAPARRDTVQLTGSHDERCARAADALVELFAQRGLCSLRGQRMK